MLFRSLVLFIAKKKFTKQISDTHLAKELKIVGLNSTIVKFFLDELNKHKENLLKGMEKAESPVISKLGEVSWRIDVKKSCQYLKNINEPIVIVKMSLLKEEKDGLLFELSHDELRSLMGTFSSIQREMDKIKEE